MTENQEKITKIACLMLHGRPKTVASFWEVLRSIDEVLPELTAGQSLDTVADELSRRYNAYTN